MLGVVKGVVNACTALKKAVGSIHMRIDATLKDNTDKGCLCEECVEQ